MVSMVMAPEFQRSKDLGQPCSVSPESSRRFVSLSFASVAVFVAATRVLQQL